MNKEIQYEVFIKTPLHDENGRFRPLPPSACLMAEALKEEWMKQEFPDGVKPMFSVGPKILEDGTEGYSLRQEVVIIKPRLINH
jgi:hypothetical protein